MKSLSNPVRTSAAAFAIQDATYDLSLRTRPRHSELTLAVSQRIRRRSRQPDWIGAGQRRALRNPGNRAWAGVGGVVSEDARVSATPPDGAVPCRLWRLRVAAIEPVIVLPSSVPGAGRPGLLPPQPPVRSAEPPGRGRLPLAARRPACAAS